MTEAQKRAQKKYEAKNKEKRRLIRSFSIGRFFITNSTDKDKIKILRDLAEEKLKELEEGNF